MSASPQKADIRTYSPFWKKACKSTDKMADLKTTFYRLSPEVKKSYHLSACQYSLSQWDDFWKNNDSKMRYTDSVVGRQHIVDFELPLEAFMAVKLGKFDPVIEKRYQEPIAALQDWDWSPSDDIRMAYYSIYNLYQKYSGLRKIDDWLIINQSLSSSPNSFDSEFAKNLIALK